MCERPNIILMMADQMRSDCLSCAGHPDVKTPNLDALAYAGVRYENAYSACPSCVPARAALLTGMKQENHGRVGYEDRIPWNYTHTMAHTLTKAGYYTQAIGKMHVHPQRNYLGFQHVQLHDGNLTANRSMDLPFWEHQENCDDYFHELKKSQGVQADLYDHGIDSNAWTARPWMYEEHLHPTNWVTEQGIDFLRRRDPQQPFFLFLSYVRPHPPFDAPQCFFDLYENASITPPVVGDWADPVALQQKGFLPDSDTGPCDPEMMRRAQIGYYACISHLDNQIGRFMMSLNRYSFAKNTVILFVSDHGELLGDHHTYRKVRPYQGSIHIPFLISGLPQKQPATLSQDLVELQDVFPTILSIVNAQIPSCVDGENLLDSQRHRREYLHGEHSGFDGNYTIGNQYIVTQHDKFIWFMEDGREQYFNLQEDPHELHNQINNPKFHARIDELRNDLIQELQTREEGYVQSGALVAGRPQQSILSQVCSQND